MDALYFRVSSDRQTAQNQFEDLLQVAEKDGSARDWDKIRQALADCIYEEQLTGNDGAARTVYRLRAEVAGVANVTKCYCFCVFTVFSRCAWGSFASL
jgi:hypothetical protein